jgi:hypothetical protein
MGDVSARRQAPEAQLLQGPLPLNLALAVVMLLSLPGLIYLFLASCGVVMRRAGVRHRRLPGLLRSA